MSRALSKRKVRITPSILMAVLLSALWATPADAHAAHMHQYSSVPSVGTAMKLGSQASHRMASNSVQIISYLGQQSSSASAPLPDAARQLVWARSAGVPRCGAACGEGCVGCNCGSSQGPCSFGTACSAACASLHGAIVSQEASAFGISEVVRFHLPSAERTNSRTLTPEPPPPKW